MRFPNFFLYMIGACIVLQFSFLQYDKTIVAMNKIIVAQKVNAVVVGQYTGTRFVDMKSQKTPEEYRTLTLILALSYMSYCSWLWIQVKKIKKQGE